MYHLRKEALVSRKSQETCFEFGLRLKEARLRRRLTLKEMAVKISVSERTYKRIEKGEGSVGLVHYVDAARLLDLDFFKDWADILAAKKGRARATTKIEKDEVDF
jgi:transcriptional regulator with XRE-family HTH domain